MLFFLCVYIARSTGSIEGIYKTNIIPRCLKYEFSWRWFIWFYYLLGGKVSKIYKGNWSTSMVFRVLLRYSCWIDSPSQGSRTLFCQVILQNSKLHLSSTYTSKQMVFVGWLGWWLVCDVMVTVSDTTTATITTIIVLLFNV
jgi:hypothetical protein